MHHHPERPMMLVLLDIEERGGIARPDQVVGRIDDEVGTVLAPFDVAHAKRHHFGAEFV